MTCFTEITVLKHSRSARHAVRSSSAAWPLANKAQLMANCSRDQLLRVRHAWSIAHEHEPLALSPSKYFACGCAAYHVVDHAALAPCPLTALSERPQELQVWLFNSF